MKIGDNDSTYKLHYSNGGISEYDNVSSPLYSSSYAVMLLNTLLAANRAQWGDEGKVPWSLKIIWWSLIRAYCLGWHLPLASDSTSSWLSLNSVGWQIRTGENKLEMIIWGAAYGDIYYFFHLRNKKNKSCNHEDQIWLSIKVRRWKCGCQGNRALWFWLPQI